MPDTTNPWAIDFNQFKAATDPYLKDGNFWSDENGSLDSGPQLQLANGKTWRPSGWQSGITYHPKGEVTYETSFDGNGGEGGNQVSTPKTNEDEYWEVRGDLSEMTGQAGSEKHVGIKYKKEGDKLVPIEDPLFRDYTTKYGTINRGLIAIAGAGMAANAGLFGNLGGTAAATGETFISGAEAFKAFEFSNMAATNAAFDASVASGAVTIPTAFNAAVDSQLANVGSTALETVASTAETVGNVAEKAQNIFRTSELNLANTVAGKAAVESTTTGLYNIITNGIRNATSYVADLIGVKDTGLLKDLKDVLSIGGTAGAGTSLFDYLMKGLQGAANNEVALEKQRLDNQGRIDVANINATNNLDILKLKDQQTQDANKRYSSSVSGINYGLINSTPKPLTRNDGSRVFSGNGLINRG